MRTLVSSTLALLVFATVNTYAQDMMPIPTETLGNVVITPNANYAVWSDPPGGSIIPQFRPSGKITAGDYFFVDDQKIVPSIFGNQVWLKVEALVSNGDGDSASCDTGCWVYAGRSNRGNDYFSSVAADALNSGTNIDEEPTNALPLIAPTVFSPLSVSGAQDQLEISSTSVVPGSTEAHVKDGTD